MTVGAAPAGPHQLLTTPGGILGTPTYISPEQAYGEPVGPALDIYSLTYLVFEMLAGHPPSRRRARVRHPHAPHRGPAADRSLRASMPSAVGRVLERALTNPPQTVTQSACSSRKRSLPRGRRRNTDPPSVRAALPAHNLPGERTYFIGRERELAECARLLDERVCDADRIRRMRQDAARAEVAERMLPSCPDGVW